MPKHKFKFLLILFLLFLSGCQQESKGVNIFFFSNIPATFEDTLEQELSQKLRGHIDVNIHLYPRSREKFAVLLSQKSGDIYIADQEYIQNLIGKEGLTALDVLDEQPLGNKKRFKPFSAKNKKTGELSLYGVPLNNDLSLFDQIEINHPVSLAAILPKFSKSEKESMEVMKYILEIEGGKKNDTY